MKKGEKEKAMKNKKPKGLLFFHGRECGHCIKMEPIVERLEKEEGLKIIRAEVWHDEENAEYMGEFSKQILEACGGYGLAVPAFVNTETNKALCGEVDYETLKKWATEK